MDIKVYLHQKRALVDAALERFLPVADGPLARHVEAMRYSLLAGGKRVRPILCLAAAEALLPEGAAQLEPLLPAACALECIHTYSLVHDDLPAMDNDDLRRGKPTNHVVFGEAAAILAGDGLLSFAFELLADTGSSLPAEARLQAVRLLSRAVGPFGMVGGQVLDMENEGQEISFDTLRRIHSLKTGALITASVETGAVLAGAGREELSALAGYGRQIGLAFQIVDDLLNVESTTEQLGKAAGSDAQRRKATYPAFFGVEETRKRAHEAVAGALEAIAGFDQRAEPLRELARYIVNRKR